MRKSKFTESRVMAILGEGEAGLPVAEVCRKHIRLGNGPEMTSEGFTEWAREHGVQLLFIQPGKPNQNAFIERFNKSFCYEVLDVNLFNSITEVQAAVEDWLTTTANTDPTSPWAMCRQRITCPGYLTRISLVSNCPRDSEVYESTRVVKTLPDVQQLTVWAQRKFEQSTASIHSQDAAHKNRNRKGVTMVKNKINYLQQKRLGFKNPHDIFTAR